MNVVIVDNEIYLAQSIQNNLSEKLQAKCEIFASYDEALNSEADVYIISTTLNGNIENLIDEKKDKIIILLAPYVTYSTVTSAIEKGADDYLQKPFSIEELIRKITHLKKHYQLKEEIENLDKFVELILDDITIQKTDYQLPLFVKTNHKKAIEKLAFLIAKKRNKPLCVVDLKNFKKSLFDKDFIYFCYNSKYLDEEKKKFLKKIPSIVLVDKNSDINAVELNFEKNIIEDEILSIEDYIKHIIITHQNHFPDTELSKKLGISRKSLWEKRKKYGIFKQK